MKGPDGAFRQKQKQKENKNEITTEQVENRNRGAKSYHSKGLRHEIYRCHFAFVSGPVPLLHCGVRTAIEQTGNTGSAALGGLACCRPRLEKRSEPAFAGDPESDQGALRKVVRQCEVRAELSNAGRCRRTGEETWRAGPGGFTFLDEVHLPTPEGEVFLLGIIWWDGKTKSFHGMECNNQLPYTCDLKGALNDITMKWDGKEFTIDELETSPDGKKMMWHEVWSDITPTSFTQTGDMGEPGGPFNRFLTIHGTRLAASKESSAEKPEQAPTGEVQARHISVSFAPGERP
jgi:hypothetical protein